MGSIFPKNLVNPASSAFSRAFSFLFFPFFFSLLKCMRSAASKTLNARTMHTFQIKTYRKDFTSSKPHFFILSKGLNAGKPLETPCPNCFTINTESEEARNFYFWLSYGLWQARAFTPHLTGSVVPFIRLSDARAVLLAGQEKALKDRRKYLKSLALLQDFEKKSKILQKQVELVKQVKRAIMFQILLE